MAKAPCSQWRGPGFDPWLGNEITYATTKSSNAAAKIVHAATKNEILNAAIKRHCMPQLRPGAAKYINKNKYLGKNKRIEMAMLVLLLRKKLVQSFCLV